MIRQPTVADQFYPADPKKLQQTIQTLTPASSLERCAARMVVVPHAGYMYSGAVAAEVFAKTRIPDQVIILGPNHHGRGAPLAVMTSGTWAMPFGTISINRELAEKILQSSPLFENDETAHVAEHSLEVQVPFLQFHTPSVSIVPICISALPYEQCETAGRAIAEVIRQYNEPVLLVASTDMTHYESRQAASKKDSAAMQQIDSLHPKGLYSTVLNNRISMCGIMPTTIALTAAKSLGGRHATRVRYTDSGETSGDTNQVVGYAGYIIS